MEKKNVCGLLFSDVTMEESIDIAASFVSEEKVHLVYTPNAEIAWKAMNDKGFEQVLNSASLLLPDGSGCIKASKRVNNPLREKVAGVEFGMYFAARCEKEHFSMYLLGGKPGVAEKAAEELKNRFTDLIIAGTGDGYFDKEGPGSDEVIEKINQSKAEVVYVCLGAPAQEIWTYNNRDRFRYAKVIACLGGSLDIYSGNAERAPEFFLKTNTEWLYRLIKEPKRFKRMSVIPKYLAASRKFKIK